ncbi:GNAT family N-acetyltransferase [Cohnella boryungensis]|uniref:GNAT family N-acetyltransferase n=1 Tax=Cohnella boryungensis TaxID=768479 RepID=A0ABV8S6Z9_9BACL
MIIRKARAEDIESLIRMRYESTLEHQPEVNQEYERFASECQAFLDEAIRSDRWHLWVAEVNGIIVSHVYIQPLRISSNSLLYGQAMRAENSIRVTDTSYVTIQWNFICSF